VRSTEPRWTRVVGWCHPGPVTPPDDLSPPRRPIFFPVVIATVFLTIIGMTIGFMLGERHRNRTPASDQYVTGTPTTDNATRPPTGTPCPDATLKIAAEKGFPTDLRQIFKVHTNNDTYVWICQDNAGSLYFQSQTHTDDGLLVQNRNGLFLSQVIRRGDNDYLATADNGNRFLVSEERLEVQFADGRPTQVNAVETVG